MERSSETDRPGQIEPNPPPVYQPFVKINTNSKCLCHVADFPDSFFSTKREHKHDDSFHNTRSTDINRKKSRKDQTNVTIDLEQQNKAKEQNIAYNCNSEIDDKMTVTVLGPNESNLPEECATRSNVGINDSVIVSNVKPEISNTPAMSPSLKKSTMTTNDFVMMPSAEPDKSTKKPHPTEGRWTSGKRFENSILELMYEDFISSYSKLSCDFIPVCTDLHFCKEEHNTIFRKQVTPSQYPSLFITLDTDFRGWNRDMLKSATLLPPDQYLRGDILRILFDYLMHGPDSNQATEVHYLLSSHFTTHPICSAEMRNYYIELLTMSFHYGSYFKTDLADVGVLYFVIGELEKHIKTEKKIGSESIASHHSNKEASPPKTGFEPTTFEEMQDRWEKFETIFGERDKVMKTIDDWQTIDCPEVKHIELLTESQRLDRLNTTLELILDLIVGDFLICVAKLKSWIKEGKADVGFQVPIIHEFMDVPFQNKIFQLYSTTSNLTTWLHLSKMIGAMAELLHLFMPNRSMFWKYPDLNRECQEFSLRFFNVIRSCKWSDSDKLGRLQMMKPAWLRQQVTMSWVNSDLDVQMGNDLVGIVNIVTLHIKTPTEAEYMKYNRLKIKSSCTEEQGKDISITAPLPKNLDKQNQYGERYLHTICKEKKANVPMIQAALTMPDIDINVKDNFWWTPLHEAVAKGHISNVKALLSYQVPEDSGKCGIDVVARNVEGNTALHEAVNVHSLEKCQVLVEFGGSVLIAKPNKVGETPLSFAKTHDKEIYQYFMTVITTQEHLNLSKKAKLNLQPLIINMLNVACSAFFEDYKTPKLFHNLCHERDIIFQKEKCILVDIKCLLEYQNQVKLFCKLDKILNSLSTSPFIARETKHWHLKFKV